jgi:hypothetical protein
MSSFGIDKVLRASAVAINLACGKRPEATRKVLNLEASAEGDPYGHPSGVVDELAAARERKGTKDPSALDKLALLMAHRRGERTIIPGHPDALPLIEGGNDVPLGDAPRED